MEILLRFAEECQQGSFLSIAGRGAGYLESPMSSEYGSKADGGSSGGPKRKGGRRGQPPFFFRQTGTNF